MIHTLPLERRTLFGYFSKDVEPVLRIADGDTVIFSTLDAGWKYHPSLGRWQPDFERDPRKDAKKPLAMTARAKRIYGASLGLLVLVITPVERVLHNRRKSDPKN